MGHQLASAPSPGPGAYAEKPETFSEEVSKALGGAKAKRSAAERPRSTPGGVPLSAFGPASSETKKPFLFAAAPFGSDSTFVPGPGAYGHELRGAENLENLGRESPEERARRGARARAGFGEGAAADARRRRAVRALGVARRALRAIRRARTTIPRDEHGNERETRLKQAEDAAKIRYARAGGGFAHGVWDAAGSARLAAAGSRRRRRAPPHARSRARARAAVVPPPGPARARTRYRTRGCLRRVGETSPASLRGRVRGSARERAGRPRRVRGGDGRRRLACFVSRRVLRVLSVARSSCGSLDSTPTKPTFVYRSSGGTRSTRQRRRHALAAPSRTRRRTRPGPRNLRSPVPSRARSGSFPKGTSAPFRSASARFGSSRTPAPGPGHYEPRKPGEDMNKRSFNATVDGAPNAFRGELAP